MNLMDFPEHPRRKNISLQLAPMIDIFTLIIVFLLQSTVIGTTSVTFPPDLSPPQSKSVEDLENAPTVEVYAERVIFKPSQVQIPASAFLSGNFQGLSKEKLQIQSYLKNEVKKNEFNHLNLVADRAINYELIFQVVKFFKETGFQSVLFVAQGESR